MFESRPPLKFRLLKAQLASIEVSIPPEALEPVWCEEARKSWSMELHAASSAENLLKVLTSLEGVIQKDFLSNYETTKELLTRCNLIGSGPNSSSLGEVSTLPWIPETTSAVALRLTELDASICYTLQQKEDLQKDKVTGNMAPPSKYTFTEVVTQDMLVDHLHEEGENIQLDSSADPGNGYPSTSRSHAQGRPRAREMKSQGRVVDTKSEACQKSAKTNCDKFESLPLWKGQSLAKGGRKRARRSARNRQKTAKQVAENSDNKENRRKIIIKRTLISSKGEESKEQTPPILVDNADNLSSSGSLSDSDNNASSTMDEYNPQTSAQDYSQLGEDFDYGVGQDGEEDYDEQVEDEVGEDNSYEGDDYEESEHANQEVGGYYNGDSEEEGGKTSAGGDHFGQMDEEESRYSSSEYSD